MKTAVLFDLDNTLTHRQKSIYAYSKIFLTCFEEQLIHASEASISSAISTIDNEGHLSKKPPFVSIKAAVADGLIQYLEWKNAPHPQKLIEFWKEYFPKSSVPMPGLHQVLKQLKAWSYSIGVVSNGTKESRYQTIKTLNIEDQLDLIISSGEVGFKKPDSKIFKYALNELDTPPASAWFVGDNPVKDILGARRMGIKSIWLTGFHPWPKDIKKNKWEVKNLLEILKIVR